MIGARIRNAMRSSAKGPAARRRRRWLGGLALGLALTMPQLRPALADPSAAAVVTSAYRIPLQSFAYHPNPQSTYYKYGINLSLGGSTSPQLFEFDTGGDGFYAAYSSSNAPWWGPAAGSPGSHFSKTFDSGLHYEGDGITTSISFFGLGSNPGSPIFTTPSLYTVAAADRIKLNGSDVWTSSGSSGPPVETNFYGDFGLTLKRGGDGIENLLAQLTYGGDVTAGYSVAVGRYGSSGNGYVQLGLLAADRNNPATTWFAMQGSDPSRPFANSHLPSFSAELINGDLKLDLNGSHTTLSGLGLNLDSGTPGVTLHYNDSDRSQLDPYSVLSSGEPVRLQDGVALDLRARVSGTGVEESLLAFLTGDNYGLNEVLTRRRSDKAVTYLNSGASLFQNYVVTYDLQNQLVGLTPYPVEVPGPAPLAAAVVFCRQARALRRRLRPADRRAGGAPPSASND